MIRCTVQSIAGAVITRLVPYTEGTLFAESGVRPG
jgi:hypothetical protein